MANIQPINNGEGGLSVRTKLNQAITEVNKVEPVVVDTPTLTAENDKIYHTTVNTTITDPTGVEGRGYVVKVLAGTTTIGGVDYAEGNIINRVFEGGVWKSISNTDKLDKGGYTGTAQDLKNLIDTLDIDKLNLPESYQSVKAVDDELFIGYKYDELNDITIYFKKCMFNELMTFFRVGLASNATDYPLINPDRATDTNLNVASSDNIGPLNVSGGGWTGANHSYNDEGIVKTAQCLSYNFYADGKEISNGEVLFAENVTVKVVNLIFDPRVAPSVEDTILSTKLCYEYVTYIIEKGSIYVSLSHRYVNGTSATIETYYGMQSMFVGETDVMTPLGEYTDFSNAPNSFTKLDYPYFNRFIEKNTNNYQSTYLLTNLGIGNHSLLDNADSIYVNSSAKNYHRLMSSDVVNNGDILEWNGFYNWFYPHQNNDEALIYSLERVKENYLFIDIKKDVTSHLKLPDIYIGKEYDIIYQTVGIMLDETVVSSQGLKLSLVGTGTLVLSFKNLSNQRISKSLRFGNELVTNGDFENGLIGLKGDGFGSISTWELNDVAPISGNHDGKLDITKSYSIRPFINFSAIITSYSLGKTYKFSFDYKVNSVNAIIQQILLLGELNVINETITGEGTFEYIVTPTNISTSKLIIYFGATIANIQIDNISLKEVLNP